MTNKQTNNPQNNMFSYNFFKVGGIKIKKSTK